jgi:hypothetical protein
MADVQSDHDDDLARQFPGPIVLPSSRLKWWSVAIASACAAVPGAYVCFLDARGQGIDIHVALGTAFSGIGCILSVCMLLPGSCRLRLDEAGFEITRLFRTQRFVWSEVSDFGTWTFIFLSSVVFRTTRPRLDYLDRRNAGLTGGRDGYVPDTYRLGAKRLARIMTAWRNAAMQAANQSAVHPTSIDARAAR